MAWGTGGWGNSKRSTGKARTMGAGTKARATAGGPEAKSYSGGAFNPDEFDWSTRPMVSPAAVQSQREDLSRIAGNVRSEARAREQKPAPSFDMSPFEFGDAKGVKQDRTPGMLNPNLEYSDLARVAPELDQMIRDDVGVVQERYEGYEPFEPRAGVAFDEFSDAAPGDLSRVFDFQARKSADALNSQLAAQGLLGSTAGAESMRDLYADLASRQALGQAQYGLDWASRRGSLGSAADQMALQQGYRGDALAGASDQAVYQRAGALADLWGGLDRQRRNVFDTSFGASQQLAGAEVGIMSDAGRDMMELWGSGNTAAVEQMTGLSTDILQNLYDKAKRGDENAIAAWSAIGNIGGGVFKGVVGGG